MIIIIIFINHIILIQNKDWFIFPQENVIHADCIVTDLWALGNSGHKELSSCKCTLQTSGHLPPHSLCQFHQSKNNNLSVSDDVENMWCNANTYPILPVCFSNVLMLVPIYSLFSEYSCCYQNPPFLSAIIIR